MSGHHPLTTLLVKQHGEPLREIVVRFNNFPDGDTHCTIEGANSISGAKVLICHYLYPNQNEQIVRLLFLVGTLSDLGAASVEVFVPYLPYARQDKAHLKSEIITSRLLCRLLHTSGVSMLHTIDCHFMKGRPKAEVEGLAIYNTLVQDRLIEKLQTLTSEPYDIIGPDAGSSYLARAGTMKKTRAASYGQSVNGSIYRSVRLLDDKRLAISIDTLVVADDMVSTGATMVKAIEALRARGVSRVYAMVSHGLFLGDSLNTLRALTAGVIYSDTVVREGGVPVVEAVLASIVEQRM